MTATRDTVLLDVDGTLADSTYHHAVAWARAFAQPAGTPWPTERWPRAELRIIPDAGHSAAEPGIRRALIEATDRFAGELA